MPFFDFNNIIMGILCKIHVFCDIYLVNTKNLDKIFIYNFKKIISTIFLKSFDINCQFINYFFAKNIIEAFLLF